MNIKRQKDLQKPIFLQDNIKFMTFVVSSFSVTKHEQWRVSRHSNYLKMMIVLIYKLNLGPVHFMY